MVMPEVEFESSANTNRNVHIPLRVAIVGCGAISEQMHLPIVAGHETVELSALVDRDTVRAQNCAADYGVKHVFADCSLLTNDIVDAAIIATPPFHHAPCAIDLMQKGIHVLVEKPMATTLADAERMVDVADEADVVLACSLFRRLYPSVGVVKSLLQSSWLGRPLRADLEGGSAYGWSAATLGNMQKELAGGGVLMDMGPHYFDQLVAIFGSNAEVVSYRDNALGGIESDCAMELQFRTGEELLPVHIELSRTRNLRNTLQIDCERGTIELSFSDRYEISVTHHDLQLNDANTGFQRNYAMQLGWTDEPETEWYETFRAETDDWAAAIAAGGQPQLSGRSALPSLRLIDECYRQKEPLPEPWVEHPLRDRESSVERKPRRVLITGATGFIGCRVAEILSGRAGYDVRALVHNPANASRLSRLPVDMWQADICDVEAMQQAVAGCDTIVHCAIGTTYWDWDLVAEITIGGTKNLVQAAKSADISRFIHLSSIAVHGNPQFDTLNEHSPRQPDPGDRYGRSKLAAEDIVRRSAAAEFQAVILRPGCVYGPFGTTFTTRPIEHLVDNRLVLENSANSPSNTVYVDNLVQAIVMAIEEDLSEPYVDFVLADDDSTTWGEYYSYFATSLNSNVRYEALPETNGTAKSNGKGFFGGVGELLKSSQFKEFGKTVLDNKSVGGIPRFVLKKTPGLESYIRNKLGSNSAVVYSRPPTESAANDMRITPRHAEISSDKIREQLGFRPLISRLESYERTLGWLRHSLIVKNK